MSRASFLALALVLVALSSCTSEQSLGERQGEAAAGAPSTAAERASCCAAFANTCPGTGAAPSYPFFDCEKVLLRRSGTFVQALEKCLLDVDTVRL